MIKATNLMKRYERYGEPALNGVSLEIEKGEFLVICGASGSGKSTLLNLLSGLERADEGEISFDGVNLSTLNDDELTLFRRKKVGFVFQQYYLLPHLSVDKNIKLGAYLAGEKNYRAFAAAVELGDKLKKYPSELSGGEQQRVCIARALAKNPEVLFADEPTGALDENTGRKVLDLFSRLRQEKNFTLVMVTHNLNIARMADRVIYMNSGKIVSQVINDSPESAYEIGW